VEQFIVEARLAHNTFEEKAELVLAEKRLELGTSSTLGYYSLKEGA
jgi:hypothetical protein